MSRRAGFLSTVAWLTTAVAMTVAAGPRVAWAQPVEQARSIGGTGYLRTRPHSQPAPYQRGGWQSPAGFLGYPAPFFGAAVQGQWYARPYPYHFDYYRWRWGPRPSNRSDMDCPCAANDQDLAAPESATPE